MILLLNCFITPSPMNGYERGYMDRSDNFDTLRYTISSLAAIDRWSLAIFRIRLDDCYAHRAEELGRYIQQEFGPVCPRIEYTYWRNESQQQWREEVERLEQEPDPYVWYTCNHDHVFIDYDREALDTALSRLDEAPEPRKSIYFSHFPEVNRISRAAYPNDFQVLPCGTVSGRWDKMDTIQIVSKPLLRSFWFDRDYGNRYLPRSDWEDVWLTSPYRLFIPFREICRHFDGYSHIFDIRKIPPLAIPPGFFDRDIKIYYAYWDNKEGYVSINPRRPYRTETPDGVDYKWVLEDIPLFWKGRISSTWIWCCEDAKSLCYARNQAVRDYICCPSNHHVLGGHMPPEEYVLKSMREIR